MTTFQIPRQTDREVILALNRIRIALKPLNNLHITLLAPRSPEISLPEQSPEDAPQIKYILDTASAAAGNLILKDNQNRTVLQIDRTYPKNTDTVTVHDDWCNYIHESTRSQCCVALIASARKELKAADLEAAFHGAEETAWNRYRDAQAQVVNSLQQTTEALLIKVAERNAELDKARDEKFAAHKKQLNEELAAERAKLEKEIADQKSTLGQREKAIADREAAFQTKEARYQARQKQQEQIAQLEEWLEQWSLTKGTSNKRWWVTAAYIFAILFTGTLTAAAGYQNYRILDSAEAITKLTTAHWVAMALKTLFPFAAFTTFITYFIRWSAAWARQHAEEEFRTRKYLVDIGRASWLLETVHDAQEHNKEVPPDLLKELSRNIFAHNGASEQELHPQAAADLLLQGLSSIRVKTADGSEVEAKAKEKKK